MKSFSIKVTCILFFKISILIFVIEVPPRDCIYLLILHLHIAEEIIVHAMFVLTFIIENHSKIKNIIPFHIKLIHNSI